MTETELRQSKLQELETELDSLLARLDFLVQQFSQLIPGKAEAWIRQEFARGIKDNAEQVQDLGVAGVKMIKSDMEHLIHELPHACAELLHDPANWAHREDELLARSSVHKEFFLDRVFRDLISSAGPILERHDLLGNAGSHSYWQRVKTGWRYGMSPTADPVAPELSEEYKEGLQRLREVMQYYLAEKRCLAEVRAQTLWDSV
jgi:hypothetical protein